jgi:hypothetical protein
LARAHITEIVDTALAVKINVFNTAVHLVGGSQHERSLLAKRAAANRAMCYPPKIPFV